MSGTGASLGGGPWPRAGRPPPKRRRRSMFYCRRVLTTSSRGRVVGPFGEEGKSSEMPEGVLLEGAAELSPAAVS